MPELCRARPSEFGVGRDAEGLEAVDEFEQQPAAEAGPEGDGGDAGGLHAELRPETEAGAEQVYASRVAALPQDTLAYCTHEYTLSNLAFAQAVEPENADIASHVEQVRLLRAEHRPSLPTTLALERRINPFLRSAEPAVRAAAEAWSGHRLGDPMTVFAALRRWKDGFRAP